MNSESASRILIELRERANLAGPSICQRSKLRGTWFEDVRYILGEA